MPKFVKALLIFLGVLILAGLLIYYFFFGVTKKQKYTKCLQSCEKNLLLESSKQYCPTRCQEITNYQGETKNTTETKSEDSNNDIVYYCEWSWPQKIINKDTKEIVEFCTPLKPYCNKADGSYEKVGCCERYDKTTENYVNCTLLKDIQH